MIRKILDIPNTILTLGVLMKKKKFLIFIFFIFLLISIKYAQTKLEDVETFTLNNGMKFILLPDNYLPNISMYIFFMVGSRNETTGFTGLSHFLEHMMFNGSKKYGPKMFDYTMETSGGQCNAHTNENFTVYMDTFPSSSIENIFDLEADRINYLKLDPKIIESERSVVLSERITGIENSNRRFLTEQLQAIAFFSHPYRWPVVGYESDIKNWKQSDVQGYFNRYYTPNNSLIVITGDVTLKQVKKLAQKYFGSIPVRESIPIIHTYEPEQLGEKRFIIYKNISSPIMLIAFHVPNTASSEYYALEILNFILTNGNSSRLYKSVHSEKELAVKIISYLPFSIDPNLFYIYAECSSNGDAISLEKAILNELDDISNEGVSDYELQKAKNLKLIEFFYNMETNSGKADSLGAYEIYFGSYKKLFSAPEEIKKVTNEDIKKVAKKYFKKTNCTIGILRMLESN